MTGPAKALTCALIFACSQGCSPKVSTSACSIRQVRPHSTVLIATIGNNSSKAIKHVGILADARDYEYDFKTPLAPGRTLRDVVGGEYRGPKDDIEIACESRDASAGCNAFRSDVDKPASPAALSTIAPFDGATEAEGEFVKACSVRLVIYADGGGWSISPL
jgi:hypothetical protein